VLGGPIFVTLFYKPRWHVAGELARWATIGGWFLLLQLSADRVLLALGRTRALAMSNIASLIVTVAGAFVGRYLDQGFFGHPEGVIGFVLGTSAGRIAGHAVVQLAMSQNSHPIIRQDIFYSLALAAACAAGILLPRLVPGYSAHRLPYDIAAAVLVGGSVCAWAGLKVLKEIR
jgi:O-antigen/teichoic acid export membrane protein